MKDENTENRVIVLHNMGWSISRISRELDISRGRVRRWVVSNSVLRDTTPERGIKQKKQHTSKLDPHKSFVGDLLERYSDITGQRVYEHLKEKGFEGGVTIVRDYLKSIRQVGPKTPVRMVETDPGQRAAHDCSDYRIKFTSTKSGEATSVTFFSYILGYSRRQYISVVDDKKQPTLFRELIAAFIYLDGVPREIKSDNQKVVNLESCILWDGYQYVVPQKYMFEQCPIRITEEQMVIYSPMGEQIACHTLAEKGRKERYVGDHKKPRKKHTLVISDVILRLEAFGPGMSEYLEQVKRYNPESWRNHLRSLLALRVNYRTEDILAAVHRANKYKVFKARTIEGFLKNNSDPRYSIKLSFKPKNKNNNGDE